MVRVVFHGRYHIIHEQNQLINQQTCVHIIINVLPMIMDFHTHELNDSFLNVNVILQFDLE